MKVPKRDVQFRYYEIPPESHVLPLFGSTWIREYGNDQVELHFHNCLEIGYCIDGGGALDFGDRKPPYTKGSISVIPPKFPHHTNSRMGTKCHWEYLFVDADSVIAEMFPKYAHTRAYLKQRINSDAIIVHHTQHTHLGSLFLAIIDEYRTKSEYYIESVKSMLQSLMISIARLGCSEPNQPQNLERVDAIAAALDYVDQNFKEQISISKLADVCHISETHFRRLFLEIMHVQPSKYINRIRIQNACKLLQTTSDTIGNIAAKCGFPTVTTLNRNFREITGTTPSQHRKETEHYEHKMGSSVRLPYEGWR